MVSTKAIIAASLLSVFIATGCAVASSYTEEELGLRKTELYSEKTTTGEMTSYSKVAAGESKVLPRAFENAPPMIPHDVEGMLDLTKDNNACLGCHIPGVAETVKATPTPKSHLYDMRTGKTLAEVSPARYNCTACHAPQSSNEPLVKNEFKPEYRKADGAQKTNLLDTLNEGVK